ncbi:MAG TPA: alpha-galactosidase, partial [Acidobacteriaceae bacterium]|nr:alpha-galactosidase [Acidobacteriaceae bacterium]
MSATATIRTGDVRLELRAGEHAPMLITLSAAHGDVWHNAVEETLPRSIDLRGKAIDLHWFLKPELTKVQDRSVEFVYESAEPHLRLHWIWEARASFGPVEHRIVIENLSGEEMWLPLMESLTVNWQITHGTTLNHFYVEKGA